MNQWIRIAVAGAVMVSAATRASAQTNQQNWVDLSRIEQALDKLNDRYADVPSALNCARPRYMAESLICKSAYLRRAELLSTRAEAYKQENDTKLKIEHQTFRGMIPGKCTSERCVYEFFASRTDISLGHESPYYGSASPTTAPAAMIAPARTNERNWVDLSRIEQALDKLNDRYADVPSALNCTRPRSTAESLICKNDYLRRAELVNTRAAAAAYENATKTEVVHKKFRGEIPRRCTNEQCIYEFFVNETNGSLGGSSPYETPYEDEDSQ